MTTEVIITGSGNPAPAAGRAGPGVAIRCGGTVLQFDAGRATVLRLAEAGISVGQLTAFFATHHHSDHLTGLQDLVLTRWVQDLPGALPPLPLVVPAGPSERFAETMLDCWADDIADRAAHSGHPPSPRYDVVPFDRPSSPTEVWSNQDARVLAGPVRHEPLYPAVGFRVETPDGVVAITGDTIVCDEVGELAAGADVVVYEAIRSDPIRDHMPILGFILDYHADTRLIGQQMAALEVETAVLTHLIPAPTTADERHAFEQDVRGGGFNGRLIVADDLDTIRLDTGTVTATTATTANQTSDSQT